MPDAYLQKTAPLKIYRLKIDDYSQTQDAKESEGIHCKEAEEEDGQNGK